MKRVNLSVILRIVLIFGLTSFLLRASGSTIEQQQNDAKAETVETRLTELFDICKRGDGEDAAAYFVYRGADKSREWKDTFRASDAAEKAEVEEVCRRIKGYLEESDGYQFGRVEVEREAEGEWHVLEVSFTKGSQTKKVFFAFLPIKGQFAIGDIDG